MNNNDILTVYGTNPAEMARAILTAARIEERIPSKQARIGLKPNLILASPAERGATTHPGFVRGAIDYLRAAGFENLVILEGSWVGDRTSAAFEVCGYNQLSRQTGVPLIDTQKDKSRVVDCAGMDIAICESALSIDFLINFPVMKGHCQTSVTCALKNMKGLITNREKQHFHAMGLNRPIAHLNARLKQGFILVDAICGDLDFEEGGNPVVRNQAFGFVDPVLCDAYISELMGYETKEVPYIGLAQALGVGSADTAKANLIELNQPETARTPAMPSGRVRALSRYAQPKDACSACYANLIMALNRLNETGELAHMPQKIAIGQGYRGQEGALGVGNCTRCFEKSLAGCPPKSSDIIRFLREKAF